MADDLDPLEQHLLEGLRSLVQPAAPVDVSPIAEAAWRAERDSRLIDHAARWLQAQKLGFYTIGSAGHESNALVALALRPSDPALLHYRSGGFYLARAGQVGHDGVHDILLGMAAATEEPIAGGRHKVFGHHGLAVIPQTSTIASHLPRAVGVAVSIERARRLGLPSTWPEDAVVVCSFGDASLNHATAQSALNWAAHAAYRGESVPILFVCEDNGIGISVPTPESWVEQSLYGRPELAYERASGDDAAAAAAAAAELAAWVREHRHPAVLHLETVRYLSHAGADVETAYRSAQEIRADYDRDPLLAAARWLVASGSRSGVELADEYLAEREAIRGRALEATRLPQLASAADVVAPLAPRTPDAVAAASAPGLLSADPMTLAQAINASLGDVLERFPAALVFGEDVARKGGVYGVTRGLQDRFGEERVFDTLLDETSILGLALGAGVSGLLPLPEIQYLAYLHNAEDQLRGKRRRCASSPKGRTATGWSCGSRGTATRRASAGTFTTTTGSASSGTSRGS